MKNSSRFVGVSLFVALGGASLAAQATTEPPTTIDARSAGMGSTAVAHAHNGSAVYHNVALLHETKTVTATASFAAFRVSQSAPVDGPNTSVDSNPSTVPIFLVGGGLRLSERFVVGLGAYTTGGFGSEYTTNAPGPNRLALGAIEFAPVMSVSLADNFALGVGYRVTYMVQELSARMPVPPPAPDGTMVDVDSDLSGWNTAGLHVGAYYRPVKPLKLGLAYRSKITATLEGTSTAGGQESDTTQEFSFPHALRVGAAYEPIPETLVIAVDVRYLMHAEANEEIVSETGGMETVQELDWKDSIAAGLGAEYFFVPAFAGRLGYSMMTSATPEGRPGPFFLPAGIWHTIHAGAGLKLARVDLDLGAYYGFAENEYTGAFVPPAGPMPGKYTANALAVGLGVTYRN